MHTDWPGPTLSCPFELPRQPPVVTVNVVEAVAVLPATSFAVAVNVWLPRPNEYAGPVTSLQLVAAGSIPEPGVGSTAEQWIETVWNGVYVTALPVYVTTGFVVSILTVVGMGRLDVAEVVGRVVLERVRPVTGDRERRRVRLPAFRRRSV